MCHSKVLSASGLHKLAGILSSTFRIKINGKQEMACAMCMISVTTYVAMGFLSGFDCMT